MVAEEMVVALEVVVMEGATMAVTAGVASEVHSQSTPVSFCNLQSCASLLRSHGCSTAFSGLVLLRSSTTNKRCSSLMAAYMYPCVIASRHLRNQRTADTNPHMYIMHHILITLTPAAHPPTHILIQAMPM